MDRLNKYKKIVQKLLQEHKSLPNQTFPNLEHLLLIDAKKQHFILFTVGCAEKRVKIY